MTTFGVRELPGGRNWEIVAVTGRGRCWRLAMAGSDEAPTAAAVTLAMARGLWKTDRRSWLPDYSGGAGVRQLSEETWQEEQFRRAPRDRVLFGDPSLHDSLPG